MNSIPADGKPIPTNVTKTTTQKFPQSKEGAFYRIEGPKLTFELTDYLNTHKNWHRNAIAFTKRYIDEGLRDRAITRYLDWGIAVPKAGYEDKKIYIVLGYLSASTVLCRERKIPLTELFGVNAQHYYVHGKDNIPFHTIILPSLLLAHGGGLRLPDGKNCLCPYPRRTC